MEKWAAVLEEYAVRYGDRVKGWWIDGCYRDYFKYTDELLEPYYKAVKKGNPEALAAMNNGVFTDYRKNYEKEDFVCGEFNDLTVIPKSRYIDGAQAFLLAPLGETWARLGSRYSGRYLRHFTACVNEAGVLRPMTALSSGTGASIRSRSRRLPKSTGTEHISRKRPGANTPG